MNAHDVATFVFDTTHAALWAEEVAQECAIPAEVVPAPSEANAKCDLALITPASRMDDLAAALKNAGVIFLLWPRREDRGPTTG